MAYLARYAHLSPLEFDGMLYADTLALYDRVRKLRDAEEASELERTKALMQASGARVS